MDKKKIGVIFGGRSSEYEVSLLSAASVIENIDRDKYDLFLSELPEMERGSIIRVIHQQSQRIDGKKVQLL